MAQRLFVFVQMEFPWILGPTDGRYLLRLQEDGEPERVVVLNTLGAARKPAAPGSSLLRRLSGEGTHEATPEPEPVSTTRVTVIDPISLSAEHQARAWLEELDREREARATVAVINRVLYAYRLATADPYVNEVSPGQAIVIRTGWGKGEQVADGRWLHARELPWKGEERKGPKGPRRAGGRARSWALRPQERLAALLGAKSAALLCEELTLRARLDLDEGRPRHAAVELDRALAAAVAELPGEGRQDLAIRIAELEQLHAGVVEQTQAALANGKAALDEELLEHALGRMEAALRARTATGI